MKMLALMLAVIASQIAVAAGPFGVDIGSDITRYPTCEPTDAQDIYRCASVPNPHSAFEFYMIQHNTGTGVCWIKGAGKDINDNGYGTATRGAVDLIASQLATNYGPHTEKNDAKFPSALWGEDSEWLMAISKSERIYTYQWESSDRYTPVNRINSIFAGAMSLGRDVGYIVVEYYGDNYEQCEEAKNSLDADVL